jgi:predicted transcriptional regulator
MACIGPDGSPTESGRKLLGALESGPGSPDEVAQATGLPLFRVRSGLRELGEGGLVQQEGGVYALSPAGARLLGSAR